MKLSLAILVYQCHIMNLLRILIEDIVVVLLYFLDFEGSLHLLFKFLRYIF